MRTDQHNRQAIILSFALFILLIIHAFYLDGSYGGGDGIRHYLVSRYSWIHHDLFLYHWGKPFFTLITSPFSQFGLIGIKLFNSLLGALSAFLSYKIAIKLGYENPLYAILISSFSPVYLMCLNSGLTEALFAFSLILAFYLFLTEKYFIACVFISFLPFVRSEGNMMLPLFALVLLLRGKIKFIPLLITGTLVYSIIGYFYFGDFFWVKNQNPYQGQNFDIYGKGELLHFVNGYKIILGIPTTILFLLGTFKLLIASFKKPLFLFQKNQQYTEELILVFGSFMVYFVAHSIFWWKGLFSSLGLERAIAGVVPCAGIIGLRGLNFISGKLKFNTSIKNGVYYIFAAWVFSYPFLARYVPMHLDDEEKVVKQAATWYKSSPYKNEKVYFLHPYFMYNLNLDPWDGKRVGELWGLYSAIKEWGIDVPVPINTVVFWDAHFGPNEAHIPFDTIFNDPNFKLINTFKPEVPFKTLGNYDYMIHAFLRVKSKTSLNITKEFFDLENSNNLGNTATLNTVYPLSGKFSSQLKEGDEFGILYERVLSQFKDFNSIATVTYSANIFSEKQLNSVLAVMSIDDVKKGSVQWVGKDLPAIEPGKWNKVEFTFTIDPSSLEPDRKIKIYLWNKGKNEFFVDDINVSINGFQ